MEIRKAYDRTRLTFKTVGESMTHQSMAPECDINRIMAKWQKTGVIEHANQFQGQYGDFSEIPTYQEAMDKVIRGQEVFMTLPSSIRRMFDNDPGQFLEFATDPKNLDQMIEMGLAEREVIEPETKPAAKPKAASKAPPEASPEAES